MTTPKTPPAPETISPQQARKLADKIEHEDVEGAYGLADDAASTIRALADQVEHLRECDGWQRHDMEIHDSTGGRATSPTWAKDCPHPAHGDER